MTHALVALAALLLGVGVNACTMFVMGFGFSDPSAPLAMFGVSLLTVYVVQTTLTVWVSCHTQTRH